jgi:hypothetical protein
MTMIDLLVNGVFTGVGTGIGSYVATQYAIRHLKNLENKVAEVKNGRSKEESGAVRESEPGRRE